MERLHKKFEEVLARYFIEWMEIDGEGYYTTGYRQKCPLERIAAIAVIEMGKEFMDITKLEKNDHWSMFCFHIKERRVVGAVDKDFSLCVFKLTRERYRDFGKEI